MSSQWLARLTYILLALGLVGYALPWIVAPSAPLTLNAYDLAEWTSLHPLQRATSPPLLAPLELRLQLLILSVIVGLMASGRVNTSISALAILLLALAQLPPFEFVDDLRNLNYSQQFLLALASLLLSLALLPFKFGRFSAYIMLALTLLGIGSAIHAHAQALDLFAVWSLEASVGAGLWTLVASYGGLFLLFLASAIRPRTPASMN